MITPDHETSSQHPHDDCQPCAVLTLCQQSPFRNGRSGPTSLRRSALEISLSAGRDAFGRSGREAGWPEPNFGPDFGVKFGFKKKEAKSGRLVSVTRSRGLWRGSVTPREIVTCVRFCDF